MKKIFLFLSLLSLLIVSCSNEKKFLIGYSPGFAGQNLPVTLLLGENGFSLLFDGIYINTPIGTFSIHDYQYLTPHRTYVQLINGKDGTKLVFELSQRNNYFEAHSSGSTKVIVEEKERSTVVTISSRTITNYFYREKEAKLKPEFPDVIIPHWIILKAYKVDWSVNNFWDLIQDVIFAIIWFFFALIDLLLIVIDLTLRFIGFFLIVIWYALSSIWR